ncbi:MAG: hypothetical protein GX657_01565 [Chloroflexi bacterium]|nr:hypothetical protein [Chloroflexota bacterium]
MFDRIARRLYRFVRLDPSVYREIAADGRATREAALIALVVSLTIALGGLMPLLRGQPTQFVLRLATSLLLGWLLWSGAAKVLGTVLYQSASPLLPVARVLGYAMAPQVLAVFGFLDCLGLGLRAVGWVLSIFFGFHAVREVMGLRSESAVVTITASTLIVVGVYMVVVRLVL